MRIWQSLIGVALMSLAGLTWADNDELDFTLVNQTGRDIHYLYVAPNQSDDWGDDLLGENILINRDQIDIRFSPKSTAAFWDLQVEYEDGSSSNWEGLDLGKINVLTIRIEKGKASFTWK